MILECDKHAEVVGEEHHDHRLMCSDLEQSVGTENKWTLVFQDGNDFVPPPQSPERLYFVKWFELLTLFCLLLKSGPVLLCQFCYRYTPKGSWMSLPASCPLMMTWSCTSRTPALAPFFAVTLSVKLCSDAEWSSAPFRLNCHCWFICR